MIHINCVDITNLFDAGLEGRDFSPFPSKIFALLYFMLHSPRPMVSYHYSYYSFNMEI